MSGSVQYRQRCVCGAEIALTENFDFIAKTNLHETLEKWQRNHNGCLVLFREVQNIRMKRLAGGNEQELIR